MAKFEEDKLNYWLIHMITSNGIDSEAIIDTDTPFINKATLQKLKKNVMDFHGCEDVLIRNVSNLGCMTRSEFNGECFDE